MPCIIVSGPVFFIYNLMNAISFFLLLINNRNLFLTVLQAEKCTIQVMTNSVSSENLLPHRPQASHCDLTWWKGNAVIFLKHEVGKLQWSLTYCQSKKKKKIYIWISHTLYFSESKNRFFYFMYYHYMYSLFLCINSSFQLTDAIFLYPELPVTHLAVQFSS